MDNLYYATTYFYIIVTVFIGILIKLNFIINEHEYNNLYWIYKGSHMRTVVIDNLFRLLDHIYKLKRVRGLDKNKNFILLNYLLQTKYYLKL